MKSTLLAFVLLAQAASPAVPGDPVAAIIDAFRTHDVVAVTEPHGNVEVQRFLLSLVRDPRIPAAVNDIVLESISARYQDAIDRFVRGEDVPQDALRRAWDEHTVANNLGMHAEELIRAVREVNASRSGANQMRVIAGDPPIDWDHIMSSEDHRRWIELRDTYPADLVRRQVIDRGRRALVVYGQGHLQRRQILSNYDMSTWQAQTLVSLLERDPGTRIFTIFTLLDPSAELPDGVAAWRVPGVVVVRGTALGARDFDIYNRTGSRLAVKNGQLVPLPREEWKTMRMEDQFDAILYLGPPASMQTVAVPRALCADAAYVKRRLERLARFAPPVEVQNFRKACGL